MPQYLIKQKSIVAKWNKFAAMEENGIAAAPRHRTKVVKALQKINASKKAKAFESPLRTNVFDQIRQHDHQLKSIQHQQTPPPEKQQATSSTSSSSRASSSPTRAFDLLAGIRAGVNLKQTEGMLKQEAVATSNHPTTDILAGIRAGVSLKRVEKKKIPKAMNQQSPTSALLAKLQARKKECLRRQQQGGSSTSSSSDNKEDDW
jgi:hypothetical protein